MCFTGAQLATLVTISFGKNIGVVICSGHYLLYNYLEVVEHKISHFPWFVVFNTQDVMVSWLTLGYSGVLL
jgi:hypothetical protein